VESSFNSTHTNQHYNNANKHQQFNQNSGQATNNAGAHSNHEASNNIQNAFPIHALPIAIQSIIKDTNECLNFPIDFIGSSILFATSIALGNTYKVEVHSGWVEGAVLYIANIGRPGTNKTHPLSFALRPINKIQEENYATYLKNKCEYEQLSKAANESKKDKVQNEQAKPFFIKYMISDFTPEALAEVHKNNRRGIGVYVDELAGWFKNFDRYHKGAEAERWLSVWSCNPIDVSRVSSEPIVISLPFISVGGNIQPAILSELGGNGRSNNGFIDRILFAFPIELKKSYWSTNQIPATTVESWNIIMNKILGIVQQYNQQGNPQPTIINFESNAYNVLSAWQRKNTDICNMSDNDALAGINSKLEIYVVRLSLILEMLSWASSNSTTSVLHVSEKTVNSAILLIEFFRKTAHKVHSIISSNDPLDKLTESQRCFYEALPESFDKTIAKKVATGLNIPIDTMNKWLRNYSGKIFKKVKQGQYEKLL